MKVLMVGGDKNVFNPATPTGKRIKEYREVLGELEIIVASGNIFSFVYAFFRGWKMMRRKKFDAITAQSPEHWLLAWAFSRISKTPWQAQVHTDIFSPYFYKESLKNKIRVWLAKWLLPKAGKIRVVSERIKDSILRTSDVLRDVRRPKIDVLPIFIDTESIKNAPIKTDLHEKYGKDKFIILMASRLTKEKNIGLAINAIQTIRIHPDISNRILLLIVGDGPEREALKSKVDSFKLNDSVVFEPWTDDLASYYKTADLFLLTSDYEGYGRTLVEAAAAEANIISSNVGIAPEILEPENIFEVDDKAQLIQRLNEALAGRIKLPRRASRQTKEDYLKLYKESLKFL